MIRILHAGDLHLCSPLAAFAPSVAKAWRAQCFVALEQLFAQGIACRAQMILLSGDVFDGPVVQEGDAARFFDILAKQPVPVVIAPGNHDYWYPGCVWQRQDIPQNVYVFDRFSLGCFDFPTLGLAVYGYAFTGQTAPAPTLGCAADLLPERACVLLAHGDLQFPLSPYAPIAAAQLESSGFCYAALGHIHNPPPPRRFGGTLAAYSGFFAGRGFDETGAGGALLVDINGGAVTLRSLPSQAPRFEVLSVDCTGALHAQELYARAGAALEQAAFPIGTAVRLLLCGTVGLGCEMQLAALEMLGKDMARFEVRDQTLPILDAAYLEKDPTLCGAFYRALLPHLQAADCDTRTRAAQALRLGLSALSDGEV